ncbi:MAG: phage tail assembly chaperone [Parvibaculaceae bacterium]
MVLGLGALALKPGDFWGMTPVELQAALEGIFGKAPSAPFARADFEVLMRAYPDEGA